MKPDEPNTVYRVIEEPAKIIDDSTRERRISPEPIHEEVTMTGSSGVVTLNVIESVCQMFHVHQGHTTLTNSFHHVCLCRSTSQQ